jgi:anaerobic magnesium-protoporphyrin IX monomethyl ester cyclase
MLIVGFSLMSVQIAHCLRIIKKLKEKQPKTKIIIGGIHAVLYPEENCEHELIDYVCYAYGEDMMVDLVEFLNNEEKKYPEYVAALLHKKDGIVQKNPLGDLPEIADLKGTSLSSQSGGQAKYSKTM